MSDVRCWNRDDLLDALERYLAWLEDREELSPFTRSSHHRYAGYFLRFLYAGRPPKGGRPRPDPYPAAYCLTEGDVERELAGYGPWLATSQLEPRGIPTYIEGASLFVAWLIGRTRRRSGRPARGGVVQLPGTVPMADRHLEGAPDWRKIVRIVPGKRGGRPVIRGLRITVGDVLSLLAAGMDEDQILADFPDLTRRDIRAALAYAADREYATGEISP